MADGWSTDAIFMRILGYLIKKHTLHVNAKMLKMRIKKKKMCSTEPDTFFIQ